MIFDQFKISYETDIHQLRVITDKFSAYASIWKKPGLQVGEYSFDDDTREQQAPSFSFSGDGRGEVLNWKFVVWEFEVEGKEVKKLALDFVQRTTKVGNKPLSGMIRYNSSFE